MPQQRIYVSAEFDSDAMCYRIEEKLPEGTYANPAGDVYYGEASLTTDVAPRVRIFISSTILLLRLKIRKGSEKKTWTEEDSIQAYFNRPK
jgi:hypothetical protein